MKVANEAVVSFHYTLRSDGGEIIDASGPDEPLAYIHGFGNIVPGLESAMEGRSPGDKFEVRVPAADGYGERTEEAVFEVPRDRLPKGMTPTVGMELATRTPDGALLRLRVVAVNDKTFTADANHPLAGQNLNFAITIVDVREATPEELAHGHVHGPGGAHH